MEADYNKILKGYLRRYRDLDENGKEYYFTVLYGYKGSNNYKKLADHTKGDTGAELLERVVEQARNYKADFITIREYEDTTENAEMTNGKGERIKLNAVDNTEETEKASEKLNAKEIIRRGVSQLDEKFEGFGGFDNYMDTQRKLMKNDYQVTVLENENTKLEKENEKLAAKKEKLEKENNELLDKCEELIGTVNELQKYAPKNFKLLGVNPIPLGAAIIERSIKNIATKNPEAVMKLTGLRKEELAGLLEDEEEDNTQHTTVVQQPHTSVQVLTEAEQAHLQVATAIFEWVKCLKAEDLKKIHELFSYFYKEEGDMIHDERIEKVIEFINQNTQDDE